MFRAALPSSARPVAKQLLLPNGRALVRVPRRWFATVGNAEPATVVVPKKPRTLRKLVFYITVGTTTFYVGSAFLAFANQPYHDFFVENVPLGSSFIQFAEENDWDEVTTDSVIEAGAQAVDTVQGLVKRFSSSTADAAKSTTESVSAKAEGAKGVVTTKSQSVRDSAVARTQSAKDTAEGKTQTTAQSVKAAVSEAVEHSKDRANAVADKLMTQVERAEGKAEALGKDSAVSVKHQMGQFSSEIQELVDKAEHIIAGKPIEHLLKDAPAPAPAAAPVKDKDARSGTIYDAPLPLGHEPPPGYSKPNTASPKTPAAAVAPSAPEAAPAPPPLPLVAPAVSDLGASEPVIAQLAGTIDGLASFLNANPAAADKARDILDTAKVDLTALAGRIDKVKADERARLEAELDAQAHEYNHKLLTLEMEAQDKLDNQEEGFKKIVEEERAKLVKAYREKLEHELQAQSEIINERLKEEVIAQGIEMQRRWIREIKVRVEQERGGRLAKLDELAAGLKRLERLALDNSTYLDENLRVHALWSALRALSHAVESPVRKPFREELRVLRHFAGARDDPAAAAALDVLEASDVPDVGVEPLADLSSWFSTAVAPRVESVALVPDQNAGLLAHLASHLFSSFRFRRQGLVQGGDVLSVLARAEYYLNEMDLDSAARELNQLKGTPKALLEDWLAAARRRLEVLQALEVLQTQATLASLLVV